MWKYKQFFVFKELGDSPHDGELDLVLCILENKDNLAKSRELQSFVNSLSKRKSNERSENFRILLEIYNKLLNFERMSFIRDSIIRIAFDNTEIVVASSKETREEFETSLNFQEIV